MTVVQPALAEPRIVSEALADGSRVLRSEMALESYESSLGVLLRRWRRSSCPAGGPTCPRSRLAWVFDLRGGGRRPRSQRLRGRRGEPSWSDEPLVVGLDAGRGIHPLVGGRLHGALARLGTGSGGGVPGGPLRIGHVRGRRRLTDALGGRPCPGLFQF